MEKDKKYKYNETDDTYISLHDCIAEKITVKNNVLSFYFPKGFWVTNEYDKNKSNDVVCTDVSQVDYNIIDEEYDSICVYAFKKGITGKIVRKQWPVEDLIKKVNSGKYRIEFLYNYKGYKDILYKCWLWFDKYPYHIEIQIELPINNITYRWNELQYNNIW